MLSKMIVENVTDSAALHEVSYELKNGTSMKWISTKFEVGESTTILGNPKIKQWMGMKLSR
jgi:hypothetical protein